jgi:polysaccharide deacetylase 2 family uncharacterized protein YibQ
LRPWSAARAGQIAVVLACMALPSAAVLWLLADLLETPSQYRQAAAAIAPEAPPPEAIAPSAPLAVIPPAPPAPLAVLPDEPLAEERSATAVQVPPAPPADARLFLAEPARIAPPIAAPFLAEEPQWQRNAVAVTFEPGRPRIAIVLDDLGPGRAAARRTIALPGPLTLAFLPYAEGLEALTAEARAAGHELLVHLPMEPLDLAHNNPGPNALMTALDAAEIERRLDWALARFEGYVGLNNHMGSAFSTHTPGLAVVMEQLHQRGLLFLDSRTVGGSLAEAMALGAGVPALGRDVFLDNDAEEPAAIWAQLRLVERIARERGQAVAIGHPHPATLEALAAWLPELEAAGFALVPVSALVRQQTQSLVQAGIEAAGRR